MLHHITQQKLILREPANMISKLQNSVQIIGYDSSSLYTNDSFQPELESPSLRSLLVPSKDIASALALETGGSVLNFPQERDSADIFADQLTLRAAAKRDICQSCDCLTDEDGKGRLQCRRCVVVPPTTASAEGTSYPRAHKKNKK